MLLTHFCFIYSIVLLTFNLFALYFPPLPYSYPLPLPAKYKHRKNHGQLTKSLQSASDTPTKPRRRPFASGELRTKAGDTDYDHEYGEKIQRNLRKLPRPLELPLNDRHEASALRQPAKLSENEANRDDDDVDEDEDDDYDEDSDNGENPAAGKQELSTWNKNKKSQLLQQMPPASTFPLTDLSATSSEDKPGATDVKPLSAGLLARLPSAPRNLLAQIVKPRFVTLSWQEPLQNANEVVSYTVYYRVNNSER